LNGKALGSGNRAQSAHQKLAANDHYSHPRRDERGIKLHQRDESSGDQQLVGERIEQYAHGGDLAAFAREIAVNTVGNRSQDENHRSQDFSFPGLLARETWSAKNPDEQRDRGDAGERDVVRKIHAMTEPGPRGRSPVTVIILHIRGQGNGAKASVQESKIVMPQRVPFRIGTILKVTKKKVARVQKNRAPPEAQEAFVSRFRSILDAISRTLLWSGTDPFGVSLSTSPGSNWAMAEPAASGEIPALAASAFT
jgi:hypothetical protein